MDYCHVEFSPLDAAALARTREVFALMRAMKSGDVPQDEEQLTKLLGARERSYFWNPTPQELAEWNGHWAATPVAVRTSASMTFPQWDLGSMYEAIWDGEYQLVNIVQEGSRYFLAITGLTRPNGCPWPGAEWGGTEWACIASGGGRRKRTRATAGLQWHSSGSRTWGGRHARFKHLMLLA